MARDRRVGPPTGWLPLPANGGHVQTPKWKIGSLGFLSFEKMRTVRELPLQNCRLFVSGPVANGSATRPKGVSEVGRSNNKQKKKCQLLCPTTKIHPSFWAPKKGTKKTSKRKSTAFLCWVSRTLQVHLAISPESGQNKSFLATKKKNISFLCQGGWKSDGPTSLNGFLIGWTNPFEKYDEMSKWVPLPQCSGWN